MRNVIKATALAVLLGSVSMAATSYAASDQKVNSATSQVENGAMDMSKLIGMDVYATESDEWDAWTEKTSVENGVVKKWDDIGEVSDVVLNADGSIDAVLVDVGGFLGLGEKTVALKKDQFKRVWETNNKDEYFIVVKGTKKSLKSMAEAPDSVKDMGMKASGNMKPTKTAATGTAINTTKKAGSQLDNDSVRLNRPMIETEGYMQAKPEELTADKLQGLDVTGSNDEEVGEISDIVLTDDGKVDKLIIDVGGFLGMGEHPIAVGLDEVNIMREKDGDDFKVYIDATKENLEKKPAYKLN
ncbi:PRC-barrel domain-containing protein [Sneathiella sp.]|uniref:PRC-barrel domain-containing protein n=1 Tax=Sneathiella sp. TaxID=1964365 RepID=UPI003564814E